MSVDYAKPVFNPPGAVEELAAQQGDTVIANGRVTMPLDDYTKLVKAHSKLRRWVDAQLAVDVRDTTKREDSGQGCELLTAMIRAVEFIHPHLKR